MDAVNSKHVAKALIWTLGTAAALAVGCSKATTTATPPPQAANQVQPPTATGTQTSVTAPGVKPDAVLPEQAASSAPTPPVVAASGKDQPPASGVTPPAPTTPAPTTPAPTPPAGVVPAVTPPAGVVPPAPTPPSGVIPSTPTLPSGVVPPAAPTTPSGVVPPATPSTPSGVVPPSNPPPGVTPPNTTGGLQFPGACVTNMQNGHHVTDRGYVAKLTDTLGNVIAAAPMNMAAVSSGFPCSSPGDSACYVLNIALSYEAAKVADGIQDGKFSLCFAKDQAAKPEDATCEDLTSAEPSSSAQYRWQYIDLPVKFDAEKGQLKITQYAGMPGDPNGENWLLVYHPAYAFAAPGACDKAFVSPLVLDLDHDGDIGLTDVWDPAARAVKFDFRGDGQKSRTGWVKPGDGFLVLDLDGSGKVTSGRQLLGEYTTSLVEPGRGGKTFVNGFQALAQLDSNGDGKIDRSDLHFKDLKVWRNRKQDGIVHPGELMTLDQAGIVSIDLGYTQVSAGERLQKSGNEEWYRATYLTKSGKRYPIADIWFKQRNAVEVVPEQLVRTTKAGVGK